MFCVVYLSPIDACRLVNMRPEHTETKAKTETRECETEIETETETKNML